MKRGAWLAIGATALSLLGGGSRASAQVLDSGVRTGGIESESEKLVKTYPFRGSTFAWYQSLNALAFDKGAELTWNPTYSWLFRFWPRYYFTDKLSVRLKLDIGLELTNADDTTRYHDAMLGDTWLDVVYGAIKEPFTGISFVPSLRLVLPTSKASRARTLYMGFGPGIALSRTIQLPKGMSLSFAWAFRYVKYLNEFTTVQYDAPTIATCNSGAGICGEFLHTGVRNPSHELQNILSVDWGITSKLKFTLMVAFFNQLLYGLTPATASLAGGSTVNLGSPDDGVSHRAAAWYYGEVSYQIHPTVNIGVGFSTFNNQLAQDSTYRAPFFNRFTEILFNTTISLDHIVALFDRRKKK